MSDDEIYELAIEVAHEFYDIYFAAPPSRETVIEFARRLIKQHEINSL